MILWIITQSKSWPFFCLPATSQKIPIWVEICSVNKLCSWSVLFTYQSWEGMQRNFIKDITPKIHIMSYKLNIGIPVLLGLNQTFGCCLFGSLTTPLDPPNTHNHQQPIGIRVNANSKQLINHSTKLNKKT